MEFNTLDKQMYTLQSTLILAPWCILNWYIVAIQVWFSQDLHLSTILFHLYLTRVLPLYNIYIIHSTTFSRQVFTFNTLHLLDNFNSWLL